MGPSAGMPLATKNFNLYFLLDLVVYIMNRLNSELVSESGLYT
jgi:hypothetical protein